MTLFYEEEPGTGNLLYLFRLVFASGMAACLALGFAAIRRRDIDAHRAWMVRAYAISLAAGTQAFTEGIGGALFGTGELHGDLAKGAGWVINLAIAEWAMRRPARRRRSDRARRPTPNRRSAARGSILMNTALTTYTIRVDGHLDDHWSAWLGDLDITRDGDGTTSLTGPIADQTQLHGVLAALRDIGVVLIDLHATETRGPIDDSDPPGEP